ncbi:MAG: hypothetical protein AAF399_30305 [Bacteroidota bacterium]
MKRFHGTLKGRIYQFFSGTQLLILVLFLGFYLVLSLGPKELIPDSQMPTLEEASSPVISMEAIDSLRLENAWEAHP